MSSIKPQAASPISKAHGKGLKQRLTLLGMVMNVAGAPEVPSEESAPGILPEGQM
jgi:hypothetical protein